MSVMHRVFDHVAAERERQDEQWGGWAAHDQQHTNWSWMEFVQKHLDKAKMAYVEGDYEQYVRSMIAVAALSVATLEAWAKHGGDLPTLAASQPEEAGRE